MRPYYYRILEIDTDASQQEIRKAYRQLAKKYHPDVNKDPDAEEHFIKIQKAWQILGDPDSRTRYDFYAKRYPHYRGSEDYLKRKPSTSYQNKKTQAYTGFGGRVYYKTTDKKNLKKEEKLRRRDIIGGVAVIILILLIPIAGKYWNSIMLHFKGVDGTAEVINADFSLIYSFNTNGSKKISKIYPELFAVGDKMVVPFGMPVQTGDMFRVRFIPSKPENHRIMLDEPSNETLDRYCTMLYINWIEEKNIDSLANGSMQGIFMYLLCDSVYEHFGMKGVANLYFSHTKKETNKYNNYQTFKKMSDSNLWERIIINCREATQPDLN